MCIGSYVTTVFSFVYIDMHIVNICQPCIAFLQWGMQMEYGPMGWVLYIFSTITITSLPT
jgi:hypothetical protein